MQFKEIAGMQHIIYALNYMRHHIIIFVIICLSRYTNPPRAILRHIILSDFKEKVPLSSFLSKTESLLVYDPLPPLDSINIYEG